MAHSAFKVTRLNTVRTSLFTTKRTKKMMENTCLKASRRLAFTIIELLRAEYFSTHKIMILGMTSYMKEINAAVFDNSNIPVMIIL